MRLLFLRRWRLWVALFLLVVAMGVASHPAAYWPVYGWMCGEAFYKGMPTAYWDREAQSYYHVGCIEPSSADPPPKKFQHRGVGWASNKVEWYQSILTYLPPQGTPSQPGASVSVVAYDAPLTDGDLGAVPVLVELLRSRSRDVQLLAIEELGDLGPAANAAVPTLRKIFTADDDPCIRREALYALRAIVPNVANPTRDIDRP